jgi:hypothetical protein
MSKTYKITLGLLVLLLVLLTWLEASEQQPVNWAPSYAANDAIPLGTKVLYENLREQDLEIQDVDIPPFEFLEDTTLTGTYFFLNNSLSIDNNELKKILKWVGKGNTAFFIAESFSENILDTLNLKTNILVPREGISSKPLLNLTDSKTGRGMHLIYTTGKPIRLIFRLMIVCRWMGWELPGFRKLQKKKQNRKSTF